MAQIHNSETTKRILDDAGIQTSRDDVPNQLASKIVPVLISNPNRSGSMIIESGSRTTTGSTTVFTTPSNKDFYLTDITLTNVSNAAADNTSITVTAVDHRGQAKILIYMPKITLTAHSQTITKTFPVPILLSRSSVISQTSSFAAGVSTTATTITGFVVDNVNNA